MKGLNGFTASRWGIILVGAVIGVLAALLQPWGNPQNMGVCVACFERDIAGALGLHRAAVVQYIRPEIIGFVLGALLAALMFREFKPRGGSAPIVRFFLGVFAMIGALVFLGCPWRALLRLAGGDLNALLGIAGLAFGVFLGAMFLKSGYTLGRSRPMSAFGGLVLPLFMAGLLLMLLFNLKTPTGAPFFSEAGPGALKAALAVSLMVGLAVGIMAQRTRFCTMGAFRDLFIIGDTHLMSGVVALLVAAFAANLVLFMGVGVHESAAHLREMKFGFEAMPVAHSNHLWNFMGMSLAGLAFCLAGGCPGRQLFLSGEGDGDAAVFVFGMIVGAGFAHNFALAGGPDAVVEGALKVGGPSIFGIWAVAVGLAFCIILGLAMRERSTA